MHFLKKMAAAACGAALVAGAVAAAPASAAGDAGAYTAVMVQPVSGTFGELVYTGVARELEADALYTTMEAACAVTAPVYFTVGWVTADCEIVDRTSGQHFLLSDVTPFYWTSIYEAYGTFTLRSGHTYDLCIRAQTVREYYPTVCERIDRTAG